MTADVTTDPLRCRTAAGPPAAILGTYPLPRVGRTGSAVPAPARPPAIGPAGGSGGGGGGQGVAGLLPAGWVLGSDRFHCQPSMPAGNARSDIDPPPSA